MDPQASESHHQPATELVCFVFLIEIVENATEAIQRSK